VDWNSKMKTENCAEIRFHTAYVSISVFIIRILALCNYGELRLEDMNQRIWEDP